MMIKKKIRNTQYAIRGTNRGAALLVVLFVIMAITFLSLGFLSQSDVELACGQNMVLRSQMDYLAESGLEHARGLILNPQNIETEEYWSGAASQQLVAGSDDYYDIAITRDTSDRCSYDISCQAYRMTGGETMGFSELNAALRVDPCITLWVGNSLNVWSGLVVDGDVYCYGNVTGFVNRISGDVYARGTIWPRTAEGSENQYSSPTVSWPGLNISDFSSNYYIDSSSYLNDIVDANMHPAGSFIPSWSNPAGIRYHNGDLGMPGNVSITGMLVVNGDLRINGANNSITAVKNFPALLVSGDVEISNGCALSLEGLAQINGDVTGTGSLNVTGGFCVGAIGSLPTPSVTVTAGPAVAAIQIWPEGDMERWSPAAGAFYKSIERPD